MGSVGPGRGRLNPHADWIAGAGRLVAGGAGAAAVLWAAACRVAESGAGARTAVAALARAPLRLRELAGDARGARADPGPAPAGAGPEVLGALYESLLDARTRRRTGAHFTPPEVADALVAEALEGLDRRDGAFTLCDPAAGGGVFLLAAARALHARGAPRGQVARCRLFGADVDELAVAVAEAALALWAGTDAPVAALANLVVADTMTAGLDVWPAAPPDGFDAVVGNPPFLGQLRRSTARSTRDAAAARHHVGPVADRYADTASVFLASALRLARPGGRVALVQPASLLGARDAAPVRDDVLARGRLRSLWWAGEAVFDATGVAVCAPVVEVGGATAGTTDCGPDVRRFTRRAFRPVAPVPAPRRGESWSPLVADLLGVPPLEWATDGRLADLALCVAGFRQHFYGLLSHLRDGAGIPLVTSGLVDPLASHWGRRAVTVGGRRLRAPAVDPAVLADEGRVGRWAASQLVPKLVVASQTRVLEAAVDAGGAWLAAVPAVAVVPPPERLWHVAAVVSAPPVSAWAVSAGAGTGRSTDAIRVGAPLLRRVPLPADPSAWADGAELARVASSCGGDAERREALVAAGEAMCRAYRVADAAAVMAWWTARLPGRPSG